MTNQHFIDLQLVEILGLSSVMDIDTVVDQGYRYEVVLETGERIIVNKSQLNLVSKISKIARRAYSRVLFTLDNGVKLELKLGKMNPYSVGMTVEVANNGTELNPVY